MMSLMDKLDQVADYLLPEKAERIKVKESPLGELARVHELMGKPEAREQLRVSWQMSKDEMERMGGVFGEIAKLHDLLRPEDMSGVLEKRSNKLKRDLSKIVGNMIVSVKRRFGEKNLSLDSGQAFEEQIAKLVDVIDMPLGQDVNVSRITRSIVRDNVRNLYTSESMSAGNTVLVQVANPIDHELELYWAWGVVKRLWESRGSLVSQLEDAKLTEALRVIAMEKIPNAKEVDISEQIEENRLALLSSELSHESEKVRARAEKLEIALAGNPGDRDHVKHKCLNILNGWFSRNEMLVNQESLNVITEMLLEKATANRLSPYDEVDIYHDLIEDAMRNATKRIDDYTDELLRENQGLHQIVSQVEDPPKRREAKMVWHKFVQGLLDSRLREVRIEPVLESLMTYVSLGGTIAQMGNELPITSVDVSRIVDMAGEAGLDVSGSKAGTITGLVEWIQALV